MAALDRALNRASQFADYHTPLTPAQILEMYDVGRGAKTGISGLSGQRRSAVSLTGVGSVLKDEFRGSSQADIIQTSRVAFLDILSDLRHQPRSLAELDTILNENLTAKTRAILQRERRGGGYTSLDALPEVFSNLKSAFTAGSSITAKPKRSPSGA